MNRLTELIDIDGMKIKTSKERPLSEQGLGEIIWKLYALEDLEDELGCPLEVVFKALKEGIYKQCTYDIGTTYIKPQYLSFDGKCLDCSIGDFLDYVNIADYQKTWWLKGDRSE